jgi:hypothetical protein
MMEAFWPTPIAAQQMPAVAKGMNAARKYVSSKTIEPTCNNTHLLRAELAIPSEVARTRRALGIVYRY